MSYNIPQINLNLNCLTDFYDKEVALKILSVINSYGKEFMPSKFSALEPLNKKYSLKNTEEVIAVWVNEEGNRINKQHDYLIGSLLMENNRTSKISYQISWEKTQVPSFNMFSASVSIEYLKVEENLKRYLELCKEIMRVITPVQGQISNLMDRYSLQPLDLRVRYPELQWINIFGKPYIDLFGREKLLNTPCYKVHEITEEIIAIQLAKTPFDEISDELRKSIRYYLNEDAFVEGNKRIISYKHGIAPEFDFSNVLFDKNKPIEVLPIIRRDREKNMR